MEITTEKAAAGNPAPVFSFVLPVYNEAVSLGAVHARLAAAGGALGEPFEIIYADDGSTDGTDALLDGLAAGDGRVSVLHLSRNFGHMAALTAGLEHARATGAVICLDADGQHPPEMIAAMVEKWRGGADIVQALRREYGGAPWLKRATSSLFYRAINYLSDLQIPQGAADFRLMDRRVVAVINALPERDRFLRGLIYWVGFRVETLPYDQAARLAGESKYDYWRMLRFALNGITSFSTRPLRLSFFCAALVALASVAYAVYVLACWLAGSPLSPGWASLILCILVLHTMELLAIGVISEYLARLYDEQKGRPVYVLRGKNGRGRDE